MTANLAACNAARAFMTVELNHYAVITSDIVIYASEIIEPAHQSRL